jgi:hypothetical protein
MSYDLDDPEHVHIHDHRPQRGGVARGVLVGLLLVALPAGAYYLGTQTHRTVLTAATKGDVDGTAPQKPIDLAPGADTTHEATQPGVGGPGSPAATAPAPPQPAVVAAAAASAASPRPAANEGVLVVECVPTCQSITIDGKKMGASPLSEVILPAGKHALVASFQNGVPRNHEAVVTAGKRTHVGLAPGAQPDADDYGEPPNACDPPWWLQEDGTRIPKPACGQ